MKTRPNPTDQEFTFEESELIVSKTDDRGIITYGNEIFIHLSGYTEEEFLGSPHNIIRHPDMPKVIFKYLWDKLKKEKEVFAFVKNLRKDGGHY